MKENFGSIGLFIIVVCWEHIMLFIKYVMHSLISPYPASLKNALKAEEEKKTEERNKSLKKKNERRSNIMSHGSSIHHRRSHSTVRKSMKKCQPKRSVGCVVPEIIPHLYQNETQKKGNETRIQKSKASVQNTLESSQPKSYVEYVAPENSPLLYYDETQELDTDTYISTPREKDVLRQRKGSHIKSSKKKAEPTTQGRSRAPNPSTPKRGSELKQNPRLSTVEKPIRPSPSSGHSPFGMYFQNNDQYDYESPKIDRSSILSKYNDNDSLSEILGDDYDDDDYDDSKYSKNMPSMSRSRSALKNREEHRAAQQRIQNRLSSVREARRKMM